MSDYDLFEIRFQGMIHGKCSNEEPPKARVIRSERQKYLMRIE